MRKIVKKLALTLAIILASSSSITTYGMVIPIRFPDGKDGYGFRPEFNFSCFLDKVSASGAFTTVLAGLGFCFLKKGITSYIERNTSYGKDKKVIAPQIMTNKAKNYGIAAAICLAPGAFFIGKNLVLAAVHALRKQ